MSNLLYYLLEVSLISSVLIGLYAWRLKKLSFHRLNRWYLLGIIPVSLLFPLIEWTSPELAIAVAQVERVTTQYLPIDDWPSSPITPQEGQYISSAFILKGVYLLGVLAGVIRLCWHLGMLFWLRRKSQKLQDFPYPIYATSETYIFSAFGAIYIPESWEGSLPTAIQLHEEGHLRQRHSYDLLIATAFAILTWFNPLVYLWRRALKQVHEYQADTYVLRQNVALRDYLLLLQQHVISSAHIPVVSRFQHYHTKNRVTMMTQSESPRFRLVRYLLLLPCLLVCLLASTSYPDSIPVINTVEEATVISLAANQVPALHPIKNRAKVKITSGFGMRIHPLKKAKQMHGGVDFRVPIDTPVQATAAGTVIYADWQGNWGKLIILDHGNGYQTKYAHLNDIQVQAGTTVSAGQIIGLVGSTGKSTAPHLHYEVLLNNERLDPKQYLPK